MNKISIAIADDHHLFRYGIKAFLDKHDEFEVVAETTKGEEVIEIAKNLQPDLFIMDIDLQGDSGIEATKELRESDSTTQVLAFSTHREEEKVVGMVQAGALGYILKDGPLEEIILAIKAIAGGNSYFSREISGKLFSLLNNKKRINQLANKGEKQTLTNRELEILEYISREYTNKEIAGELFISPRTVETHRRNLIQKLKVKNSVGLVIYYLNKVQNRGIKLRVS